MLRILLDTLKQTYLVKNKSQNRIVLEKESEASCAGGCSSRSNPKNNIVTVQLESVEILRLGELVSLEVPVAAINRLVMWLFGAPLFCVLVVAAGYERLLSYGKILTAEILALLFILIFYYFVKKALQNNTKKCYKQVMLRRMNGQLIQCELVILPKE